MEVNTKLLSKRGKDKLAHNGFIYTFDKLSSDGQRKFWRCEERCSGSCRARLHTNFNGREILHIMHEHNHGGDAALVKVAQLKDTIKQRAAETFHTPSQIVNSVTQDTDEATMGRLPKKNALRKIIQRKRNAIAAVPACPRDLQTLEIPLEYTTYEATPGQVERFLLGNALYADNERILIFGRESYSGWSGQMTNLHIDGTFKIAPPLFSQVYVILAKRGGYVFPVAQALLPNKQQRTYTQLFEMLKMIWPELNPFTISMDFEIAAMNAVRAAFPDADIFGCFFHLALNMRKKIAEIGLLRRYNNDAVFALQAKMILALAFVPLADIEQSFEALTATLDVALEPVWTWFETNYIGRLNNAGIRRQPLFPAIVWSVHERVLQDQDRTNNFAEAANRSLQSELGLQHPCIWKFIDSIRRVQKGKDLTYEQYVQGNPPPKKQQKYIQADARIRNLVAEYANRDVIEFLRGIAHNYS